MIEGTHMAEERTALYRLYDVGDQLLYIGIAVNPQERWHGHSVEKNWWPQVTRKTVTWFSSGPEAAAAEVAAIKAEHPRLNVEHSETRKRGDGKADLRGITTKVRYTRIPDDDWADLLTAAKTLGSDRGTVIKELVAWYLHRPGAKTVQRPKPGTWTSTAAQREAGQ